MDPRAGPLLPSPGAFGEDGEQNVFRLPKSGSHVGACVTRQELQSILWVAIRRIGEIALAADQTEQHIKGQISSSGRRSRYSSLGMCRCSAQKLARPLGAQTSCSIGK